jgi:3',5'-cyclic AMP phosphodiesterase CpdA
MRLKRFIISLVVVASLSLFACNRSQPNKTVNNIIVYGDSRTSHDDHRAVVSAIMSASPDIVFHTGDLVGNGALYAEWVTFNDITSGMRAAADFYPAAGNHEYESDLYYGNFVLPGNEKWYTVTYDKILFVILNSNLSLDIGSKQYLWLKNTLENVDPASIKFTAVLFHHPPFSTGAHGEEDIHLRDSIVPLFEANGVDIVFTGHDHNYERSLYNGIYYIVTGGGGAPLRPQSLTSEYSQKFVSVFHFCKVNRDGDKLNVVAYDIKLKEIDRFSLN